MYWVNTLPGRRCLLASKPADLRDGEVICELAQQARHGGDERAMQGLGLLSSGGDSWLRAAQLVAEHAEELLTRHDVAQDGLREARAQLGAAAAAVGDAG